MKSFRLMLSITMIAFVCFVSSGCKKACNDLEDVCGGCSEDYRSSCDAEHAVCDALKGKLGNDCCEAALDLWEGSCN